MIIALIAVAALVCIARVSAEAEMRPAISLIHAAITGKNEHNPQCYPA